MEKVGALSCFRSCSEMKGKWRKVILIGVIVLVLLAVVFALACSLYYDGISFGKAVQKEELQAEIATFQEEQQAEIDALNDAHSREMEALIEELTLTQGRLAAMYDEAYQMREELEAWRNGTINEYRKAQEDWLAMVP